MYDLLILEEEILYSSGRGLPVYPHGQYVCVCMCMRITPFIYPCMEAPSLHDRVFILLPWEYRALLRLEVYTYPRQYAGTLGTLVEYAVFSVYFAVSIGYHYLICSLLSKNILKSWYMQKNQLSFPSTSHAHATPFVSSHFLRSFLSTDASTNSAHFSSKCSCSRLLKNEEIATEHTTSSCAIVLCTRKYRRLATTASRLLSPLPP